MDLTSLTRRNLLLGGGLGLGLALAACSGSSSDSATPSASASAAGGFPVTVDGAEGAVTVGAQPEKVLAVGYLRDTDIAIGLGAPLVAIPSNSVFDNGLAPWQQDALGLERFDTADGLPFEKLAAYAPDLILASDDYTLADDYATLAKIAPTLGYSAGAGADSWQDMTTRAGQVLGLSAEASALVTDTEKLIEDARQSSSVLEGKSFVFGPVQGLDSIYSVSDENDASAQFFSQFGMTLPADVTALPDSETPGRALISPEKLELLEADVLILTFADNAAQAQLEKQTLFKNLDVVKRGAYVALTMNEAVAVGFPSVLSIPYGLDNVLPKIVAAAGKA